MSRIGNNILSVPSGVSVNIDKNTVKIKGPKGELLQKIDPKIKLELEDGQLKLVREDEQKRTKSLHGLYNSLVNNMIKGVSEGYKIELELVGVGYRANNTGQLLEIQVGYSHPIYFMIPKEVKLSTESEKGKPPLIRLESHDKQLIGQIAAKVRAFRKPEPYKGKGILFKGEQIKRKAGKTAG